MAGIDCSRFYPIKRLRSERDSSVSFQCPEKVFKVPIKFSFQDCTWTVADRPEIKRCLILRRDLGKNFEFENLITYNEYLVAEGSIMKILRPLVENICFQIYTSIRGLVKSQ